MKVPKAITKLIESFEGLPGIGPKTSQRLTYYLLHVPQTYLDNFASALQDLKKSTVFCSICKNVTEHNPCDICTGTFRQKDKILVVEQPLDLLVFEKTKKYNGLYHVLHGKINPLENIGPDEIFIQSLLDRVRDDEKISEIILATNPNMEGDATALFINKRLKEVRSSLKITKLGMGIPTGADLEFADDYTLAQALEGRREF